jgi:hypothetical protein
MSVDRFSRRSTERGAGVARASRLDPNVVLRDD